MKNPEWLMNLSKFEKPEIKKSVLQMLTSFVPYVALLIFMFIMLSAGISYWIVLFLSIFTSIFMVRIFIILHDCGHYSYFKSKKANTIVGYISGYILLMPFAEFRHSHSIHHATNGNLDKRGIGDVWTMTVKEYLASGKLKRFVYRGFRSPYVFLLIGPLIQFLYFNRFPTASSKKKQKINIYLTDIVILSSLIAAYYTVGLINYILVMAPLIFIAQDIGILLFFIQHQFEHVYWADSKHWDVVKASLLGSSFYKLPKVLQWITGNIMFHHVHHLRPGIPNYKLNQCFNEVPELRDIKPVKLFEGFRGLSHKLWDEDNEMLIKVSQLRKRTVFQIKNSSGLSNLSGMTGLSS